MMLRTPAGHTLFVRVDTGKQGQYENDVFLLYFPSMRNLVYQWINTHWGRTLCVENTPPSLHTSTIEKPNIVDTEYEKHLVSLNDSINFSQADAKIKKFATLNKSYRDIVSPAVPGKAVEDSSSKQKVSVSNVELELQQIRLENKELKQNLNQLMQGYALLMSTIQTSLFNTQNIMDPLLKYPGRGS